ncbi:hypothetical protein KFU94_00140 [Chloroflexi bacterium TSY]|nr:hypothetical protein [Chloroflexi bacterium TSY]
MSIYHLTDQESEVTWEQFDMDQDDPSLNPNMASALQYQYRVDQKTLNQLFLKKYNLNYISHYFLKNKNPVRIVSFPKATNTCYEKAEVLQDWDPLNVIKAFYLESSDDGSLYAIIVSETGCFLDRDFVRQQLNLPGDVRLVRATQLPAQMSFGSCSPFIRQEDLVENGGKVRSIVFDKETLVLKRHENSLDDFSFGLEHRLSIQMNYYHCYKMLQHFFANVVTDREILRLSFKERLVRKKGRIKIDYEFKGWFRIRFTLLIHRQKSI